MRSRYFFITILLFLFLTACVDQNTLTKEEIETQNKVDSIVAGTLFEHELDTLASYNVRKDGFLVIKFDKSVTQEKYTQVVDQLRSNTDINGVRAEQAGREVCILSGSR